MAEFMNIPSFFDSLPQAAAEDLMTQQLAPNQPEPGQGVFTTSDPVLPDRVVQDRLGHFDPDLYDLRDSSHLMKLLKVLLGASGLGGLRRQAAVARLQGMFNGMHFLDLDHFYGALFGIQRTQGEAYTDQNFNPYLDAADPEGWDEIQSKDSAYRSRLISFAKAIPLGATYIGLKSMAEALLSAPCEIYESWALVEENLENAVTPGVLTYTYGAIESTVVKWGSMEGTTWSTWGGSNITQVSRLGLNTRSDFVVQPKRDITRAEHYQLVRVLERFKPAGSQFIIDPRGVALHAPITPRNIAADSEYWEVIATITPNPNLVVPRSSPYSLIRRQPRPAFSQYQSEEWSYNGEVNTVTSYVMESGNLVSRGDDELVTYADGKQHRYIAKDAVMSSAQALSARLVSDGVLTTGAYSTTRGTSTRAGVIV